MNVESGRHVLRCSNLIITLNRVQTDLCASYEQSVGLASERTRNSTIIPNKYAKGVRIVVVSACKVVIECI